MMVLNLTKGRITAEQRERGCFDFPSEQRARIKGLLEFDVAPTPYTIGVRVKELARMARVALPEGRITYALIDGAPFMMALLDAALHASGIRTVYWYRGKFVTPTI